MLAAIRGKSAICGAIVCFNCCPYRPVKPFSTVNHSSRGLGCGRYVDGRLAILDIDNPEADPVPGLVALGDACGGLIRAVGVGKIQSLSGGRWYYTDWLESCTSFRPRAHCRWDQEASPIDAQRARRIVAYEKNSGPRNREYG
jgi:hypothetical protein